MSADQASNASAGSIEEARELGSRLFRSVAEPAMPDGPAAPIGVGLRVTEGPHAGRTLDFTRHESLVAGRDAQCQLHFPDDDWCSRFHFRVEVNPPAARVMDLESRNGTFVNGKRVRSADLKEGDEIKAGRTRLVVQLRLPAAIDMPTIITPVPLRNASGRQQALAPESSNAAVVVPGYELGAEIGRGGLGVVYQAVHKATRKKRAIKILLPAQSADDTATRLFLREATILSHLRHPRIVEFHEFGTAGGQLFIVMELVDSVRPEALWAGMAWERRVHVACGIVGQTLEALEYAHAKSFVHRDIKPANLLMLRTGRKLNVKLADFGMAKNYQHAGFSDLTDDRDARGSLAFMAPEQVMDCRFAGPTCDVYSVGVTLYNLLSGELPFERGSPQKVIAAILEGGTVPIDSRCPGVSTALANVVGKAMAREARDRFASAAEMRAALSECKAVIRPGD